MGEEFSAGEETGRALVAVARETSAASDESGLGEEIRAACRALGKTEEQLAGWVRKKFGAEGVGELTPADKREVFSTLQGMLARRAAA